MRSYLTFLILLLHFTLFSQDKPKVLCTASMIYDMVNNIAGNTINNKVIVPIGGDPHLYNPTPSDAADVAKADYIFLNGLTFEGWILELINNSGTEAHLDTVTNGIVALQSDKYKNAYDPHAWMDVSNALTYIQNIKNALIKLSPADKNVYEENYKSYKTKLIDLDKYIKERIQEIPEQQRVLITSHDAFAYYGKRYGLTLEAIQGMSTEAEAQTSDIVRIGNVIQKSKVPAIFIESTINPKLIKQIAEDNNVAIGGELFADSIGDEESGAHSYIDMLKHNTDVIVDALKGTKFSATKYQDDSPTSIWAYVILGFFLIGAMLLMIYKMRK